MTITELYDWFVDYTKSYYNDDKFIMDKVLLKQKHSLRVAQSCVLLAKELHLNDRQRNLAEIIGLFHDLARFRQITEFGTFVDADSFDHGDVGAEELQKADVLNNLSPDDVGKIAFAIIAHNKMLVPPGGQEEQLFSAIIRDADKLDIFRVLPPIKAGHDYSPKLVSQMKEGRILSYTDVKTLADKRLIRLSWFYDINYKWTLRQLVEEGHLARLASSLPAHEDFDVIRARVNSYVSEKLQAAVIC